MRTSLTATLLLVALAGCASSRQSVERETVLYLSEDRVGHALLATYVEVFATGEVEEEHFDWLSEPSRAWTVPHRRLEEVDLREMLSILESSGVERMPTNVSLPEGTFRLDAPERRIAWSRRGEDVVVVSHDVRDTPQNEGERRFNLLWHALLRLLSRSAA